MIRWRKKVEEYVELRRSLGFKLLDANNGLIQFASFLEQNRIVTASDSRLPVDRSPHLFYLVRRQGARYCRLLPVGDGGDACCQILVNVSPITCESQE